MADLKQITVSLELAQQLKEAGYPQESLFYWFSNNKKTEYWVMRAHREHFTEQGWKDLMDIVIAAPTASELGEQLGIAGPDKTIKAYGDLYGFKNTGSIGSIGLIRLLTQPDRLAEMWLYLKKQGLLTTA